MNAGALFILAAAVLWGIDGVLRRALFDLPPSVIVFYEHLIGAMLLLPFLIRAWSRERSFTLKDWGALGLVSLLSGVLGTIFFTAALLKIHYISFSVVFLIQKLQPLFTIFTAAFVLGERVTGRYALWAVIALVAGFFVTFPHGVVNRGEDGAYIFAALLAFAAAAAWGSSTAFSRLLLLSHSNTSITGLRFLFTVPLALAAVLILGDAPGLGSLTGIHIAVLIAIALSTGMVSLWIYYKGLQTTPASVSTILELAFPLTAIFIDYALYDTVLAWSQLAAAAVLLFAMYMIASQRRTIIRYEQ